MPILIGVMAITPYKCPLVGYIFSKLNLIVLRGFVFNVSCYKFEIYYAKSESSVHSSVVSLTHDIKLDKPSPKISSSA